MWLKSIRNKYPLYHIYIVKKKKTQKNPKNKAILLSIMKETNRRKFKKTFPLKNWYLVDIKFKPL